MGFEVYKKENIDKNLNLMKEQNLIKTLIEEWDMVTEDEWGVYYEEQMPLLSIRDEIEELGLGNHPEVVELDKRAIRNTIKYKADKPRDRERENPPLYNCCRKLKPRAKRVWVAILKLL